MRLSMIPLPSLSHNATPRTSPVSSIKLRNPFDNLLTTGSIKPVCHKSKPPLGRARSPFLLPTLSPRSPLRLPKVSSNKLFKERFEGIRQSLKSIKFIKLEQEKDSNSPVFAENLTNFKEITFGEIYGIKQN